jgi:hypothetical protein
LEENQRRQALFLEVESWQRAELIRAYVAVLDRELGSDIQPQDGYAIWREWAATVADDLYPICSRTGTFRP